MAIAQPSDQEHDLDLSVDIERAERHLERATLRRTGYFRLTTRKKGPTAEADRMNKRIWSLERALATAVGRQARETHRAGGKGADALTARLGDIRARSRRREHWLTAVARDSLVATLAASPEAESQPSPGPATW